MLPPSDSIHHQQLKLAEALSNIQTIDVPPPSYTSSAKSSHDRDETSYTDELNDDGEENHWPSAAPIRINIDASIHVEGQANTIVLPSGARSSQAAGRRTPAEQAQQMLGARGERLASMVLFTLKSARFIGGEGDHMYRPLDIQINASVGIKGEKNVICAEVPRIARKNEQHVPINRTQPNTPIQHSKKRRADSVSRPVLRC